MYNDVTKRILPSILAASDSGRIPGPVPPASNHQTPHLDLLVTTITSTSTTSTITSTHTAAASGETSPLPSERFAALLPGKRGCSCCGDGVSSLATPPGGLRRAHQYMGRALCVCVCVRVCVST